MTEHIRHGKESYPEWAKPEPKPEGYVKPKATILDQILAGQLTKTQVAELLMENAYAGLKQFCAIPKGYHHCQLGHTVIEIDGLQVDDLETLLANPPATIVNPQPVHLETIEFFSMILEGDPLVCQNRNPLRPFLGASLFGVPGTGKTHLMAAFGMRLKQLLDDKLAEYKRMIAAFVQQERTIFEKAASKLPDAHESRITYELDPNTLVMKEHVDPASHFSKRLKELTDALRKLPFQPTDLLYLGFEELCDLFSNAEDGKTDAQEAIERAGVVFIDDVHPQKDELRINVVRRLVERRYELGMHGTFITTNLNTDELSGNDPKISKRLLSRFGETFIPFNFEGCTDWRLTVKNRRVKLVKERIAERLANRK